MRSAVLPILLLLGACTPGPQSVAVRFRAVAGDQPLTCDSTPQALTDLRFYVHDVVMLASDGTTAPVALEPAPPWQSLAISLIDLETGTGACNTDSPGTHMAVTGTVPPGRYAGVRFTIGVPFELNHADPAKAAEPLDQTVMHWHWQAGYKFLRAGLRQGDASAYVHLGSTGCEGRIGAVSACAHPNRVTVTLPVFNPAKDVVAVDVAALVGDLSGDAGAQGCQSEPDNPACRVPMTHLGLSEGPQDVFHAAPL